MATLKIKELELEGFRSFKERTLITFPENGMVLISGRYTDGSMSSGSGKSSIPLAIAYVLGFSGSLPATVLRNWNSKKMLVRLRLSDGDQTIDIIRDPKLKLIENDKPYEGGAKGVDERLQDILRTTPELLSSLTYRPQRQHGLFLNNTDTQNKEFLSALLDLSHLETICDDFSREKERFFAEIKAQETSISREESMLPILSEAKTKLSAAEQSYAEALRRLNALSSNAEASELQSKVNNLNLEIQRSNQAVSQAAAAERDNINIRNQLASIDQEISVIKANICPTCRREWDKGQDRLDQLMTTKKSLLEKARGNMVIINSVTPIKEAIPNMVAQTNTLMGQIGQLKAPAEDAKRNLESVTGLVTQLRNQSAAHDKLLAVIDSAKASINSLKAEAQVAQHASELLSRNGFLSVIFDDILREIEHRANQMIGKIPNIATLSVSISSTHHTKAGTAKKTISVKVIKDGEEIPVKALSGGQQCSLELCTDLAVSESIRTRSGSPIGWMCLDEAMDGLDIENKRSALEVIRQHVTGMVLIIDHSTEIKEGFEKIISIEYDGRTSRVAAS